MPELFTILLKVNIALVLFCAGYYLVLRKLTFYTLNRVYLISAIIFSSVYPFIDLSALAQRHQEIVAPVQNVVIIWQAPAENFVKQAIYWNWLAVLFWTGVAVFALRLLFQLVSLYSIYRRSTAGEINGQTVRVVSGDISPFSFWRSIYINPDRLSPTDLNNILEHEQVHVSEWHTLDVLLTEISVIFYWFNPGIWMMKRAVRENIEFITDRKLLQKGLDSKAYQYSLLNVTFNHPAPAITSNFNFSTLKKRIKMMNAKRSSNLNLTRYAFLLPVVAVCLFIFSLSKTEVVKATPAFKAVTDAVENIKSIAFEADTTPVKKAATKTTATQKTNGIDATTSVTDAAPENIVEKVSSTLDNVKKEPDIRMRNFSGEPLYVIDGKISSASAFNAIDFNEVASVGILKDGSGSIYGNGSENGVIVVTTKKDKRAQNAAFGVDSYYGVPGVVRGAIQRETYDAMTGTTRQVDTTGSLSSQLRVRGVPGPNDPLILVDGKEQSSIEGIDQNSIESVSILKDAAATARYGLTGKAKNGVIIITTKKDIRGDAIPRNGVKDVEVVGYGTNIKRPVDTIPVINLNNLRRYYFKGKEPLLMVNGVVLPDIEKELKKMDPNDIENTTILQGPSAMSIYGEKAKNGAIIITTRKK